MCFYFALKALNPLVVDRIRDSSPQNHVNFWPKLGFVCPNFGPEMDREYLERNAREVQQRGEGASWSQQGRGLNTHEYTDRESLKRQDLPPNEPRNCSPAPKST